MGTVRMRFTVRLSGQFERVVTEAEARAIERAFDEAGGSIYDEFNSPVSIDFDEVLNSSNDIEIEDCERVKRRRKKKVTP